jgi:hypothetical protein
LWCRHTGDHPQEEIAKFSYRQESKVENFKKIFKDPAIFWRPAGTYCLNMTISGIFFPLKSGDFGVFFCELFSFFFFLFWQKILSTALSQMHLSLYKKDSTNPKIK